MHLSHCGSSKVVRNVAGAARLSACLPPGLRESHGFGLGIGRYRGLQTIGHNGGDYGIATNVSRYPDQRLAVAVLCNIDSYVMGGTTTVNPDALTNGIADIYLADALSRIEASPDTAPSPPAPLKLSDAELSGRAGLYRLVGRDLPVLLSVSHGALVLRSYYQDDSDFEVTPVGANHLLFQNRVPLEFVPLPRDGRRSGTSAKERIEGCGSF